LTKNAAGENSPCLLAVGMEAGPVLALCNGQGSGGKIRARSFCPKQLEGRRRREGGLGVQRRDFLTKIEQGKTHLAFWQWEWRLAAC